MINQDMEFNNNSFDYCKYSAKSLQYLINTVTQNPSAFGKRVFYLAIYNQTNSEGGKPPGFPV